MNTRNLVILTGRVSKEVTKFDNKDGSKKYMVSLAVQDNFKSGADNARQTQFIETEGFVAAGKADTIFSSLKVGEQITVQGSLRNNNYEKDGVKVYGQVIRIESVDFLESKATVDARAAQGNIPVPPTTAAAEEVAPSEPVAKPAKKAKKSAKVEEPFAN